jgi:hypothetical protein
LVLGFVNGPRHQLDFVLHLYLWCWEQELSWLKGMLTCAAFSDAGQQKGYSGKGADSGNKEKQRTMN